jgi:hypothetical protein
LVDYLTIQCKKRNRFFGAFDVIEVSNVSKEEIQAVIEKSNVHFLFPDNCRDPL